MSVTLQLCTQLSQGLEVIITSSELHGQLPWPPSLSNTEHKLEAAHLDQGAVPQQRAVLTPGHSLGWPLLLTVTAPGLVTLTTGHRWVSIAVLLTSHLLDGEPSGHCGGVEAVQDLVHTGPVLAVVQQLVAVAQLVVEDGGVLGTDIVTVTKLPQVQA